MTAARDILLIGTASSLPALAAWAQSAGASPVGAVVIDDTPDKPDLPGVDLIADSSDLDRVLPVSRRAVAILSCPPAVLRASGPLAAIRRRLMEIGVPLRTLPTLDQVIAGPVPSSPPGLPIDPASLLGRRPHAIDSAAVERVVRGKRVLVTGAGGSIGSELARIVAAFGPERVVLVERSENALFEIDRRLGTLYPALDRRAVLHDCTDAATTADLLAEHKPHLVLHAAAHKHVPLMEDHPAHAVTNNLFGTKSVADAALAAGAERFVLISSDKAVNPANVMGATKRLAERYVQGLHALASRRERPTRFGIVRFGNVLGSACSVLPIWSAQFADGGPITVTDERMTRYFMTIPEAASLVIQAAALAPLDGTSADRVTQPAPVFVLDMGEPVRIVELARRFALAHGLEPDFSHDGKSDGRRLGVVITGARPGEKLHEELAYAAETLNPTEHPGIQALAPESAPPASELSRLVDDLDGARRSPDRAVVLAALRRAIPELERAARVEMHTRQIQVA